MGFLVYGSRLPLRERERERDRERRLKDSRVDYGVYGFGSRGQGFGVSVFRVPTKDLKGS